MSAALFPGHDRVIDTTSAHHMEWTLGEYQVEAKVVCTSGADANCRLVGDCECESYNIQRDLDGAAYHLVEEYDYDKDATEQVRHPMRQNESCNVADWINADDPMECLSFAGSPVIARTPITETWEGDYFVWAPILDAAEDNA